MVKKQDVEKFFMIYLNGSSRLTAAIRATNKDDSNNEYFQAENSSDSDDEVIFEASSILNVQDNINANPVNENPVMKMLFMTRFLKFMMIKIEIQLTHNQTPIQIG